MFVEVNETMTVNANYVTDVISFKNNSTQKWDVMVRIHNHGDVRYRVGSYDSRAEAIESVARVREKLNNTLEIKIETSQV